MFYLAVAGLTWGICRAELTVISDLPARFDEESAQFLVNITTVSDSFPLVVDTSSADLLIDLCPTGSPCVDYSRQPSLRLCQDSQQCALTVDGLVPCLITGHTGLDSAPHSRMDFVMSGTNVSFTTVEMETDGDVLNLGGKGLAGPLKGVVRREVANATFPAMKNGAGILGIAGGDRSCRNSTAWEEFWMSLFLSHGGGWLLLDFREGKMQVVRDATGGGGGMVWAEPQPPGQYDWPLLSLPLFGLSLGCLGGIPLTQDRSSNWLAVLDSSSPCMELPSWLFDRLFGKKGRIEGVDCPALETWPTLLPESAKGWCSVGEGVDLPDLTFFLEDADLLREPRPFFTISLKDHVAADQSLCVLRKPPPFPLTPSGDMKGREIVLGSFAMRSLGPILIDLPSRRVALRPSKGSPRAQEDVRAAVSPPSLAPAVCKADVVCKGQQWYLKEENRCVDPDCEGHYLFMTIDEESKTCVWRASMESLIAGLIVAAALGDFFLHRLYRWSVQEAARRCGEAGGTQETFGQPTGGDAREGQFLSPRHPTINISNAWNIAVNNEDFTRAVDRSRRVDRAIVMFNQRPREGVAYLTSVGEVDESRPDQIARWLINEPRIDPRSLGEFLGRDAEQSMAVLNAFSLQMVDPKLQIDEALRRFMARFAMPGESQQVFRVLDRFATAYAAMDNEFYKLTQDQAQVLSYALIMLNVDAHNDKVKRKMTREQFIRNTLPEVRGVVREEQLAQMYDRIVACEFKPDQSVAAKHYAQLARNPKYQKGAGEAKIDVDLLKGGQIFMKFGRMGKPHTKFVYLSADGKRICWTEPTKEHLNSLASRLPTSHYAGHAPGDRSKSAPPGLYQPQINAHEQQGEHRETDMDISPRAVAAMSAATAAKTVKFIFVEDITNLIVGSTGTSVFRRHVIDDDLDQRCFSLITDTRSLDLQAPDGCDIGPWLLWAHSVLSDRRKKIMEESRLYPEVQREINLAKDRNCENIWSMDIAPAWARHWSCSGIVSSTSGGTAYHGRRMSWKERLSEIAPAWLIPVPNKERRKLSRRDEGLGGQKLFDQSFVLDRGQRYDTAISRKLLDLWLRGLPAATRAKLWPLAAGNTLRVDASLVKAYLSMACSLEDNPREELRPHLAALDRDLHTSAFRAFANEAISYMKVHGGRPQRDLLKGLSKWGPDFLSSSVNLSPKKSQGGPSHPPAPRTRVEPSDGDDVFYTSRGDPYDSTVLERRRDGRKVVVVVEGEGDGIGGSCRAGLLNCGGGGGEPEYDSSANGFSSPDQSGSPEYSVPPTAKAPRGKMAKDPRVAPTLPTVNLSDIDARTARGLLEHTDAEEGRKTPPYPSPGPEEENEAMSSKSQRADGDTPGMDQEGSVASAEVEMEDGWDQLKEQIEKLAKCFMVLRPDIGYVGNECYLITLVLLSSPSLPVAFQTFSSMVHSSFVLDFYRMDKPEYRRSMKMRTQFFETVLQDYLPQLKEHLDAISMGPNVYFYSWLVTGFTRVLPIRCALRAIDGQLLLGECHLFSVALGVLQYYEHELMTSNFSQALLLLMSRADAIAFDEERLFSKHVNDCTVTSDRYGRWLALQRLSEEKADVIELTLPPDFDP